MFIKAIFTAALALGLSLTPLRAEEHFAFQTPSGNIHCYMDTFDNDPSVRCDLREAKQSYTTAPKDCELDWGFTFYVMSKGASGLGCAGDTIINPTAAVLGYGSNVTFAGLTCAVSEKGVACKNKAGRGFQIAKAAQKIY